MLNTNSTVRFLIGIFAIIFILPCCAITSTRHLFTAEYITSFSIDDRVGKISGSDITVTLPYGTVLTALTADVTVPEGASIIPAPTLAQDFTERL